MQFGKDSSFPSHLASVGAGELSLDLLPDVNVNWDPPMHLFVFPKAGRKGWDPMAAVPA